MLDLLFMVLTIIILLWRIATGQYVVGGEIFLPLAPTFIKFIWTYYKSEKQAMEDYIKENPHEFD